MKFAVVHDLPGRIRLRCGQYAFTEDEGFSLQEVLEKETFVESIKVSHLTGSMLIFYKEGSRQNLLDVVSQLSVSELPPSACPREHESAKLDNNFQNRLIGKVLWHLVRKLLPLPVKTGYTCWRSCRYLGKGLKSLWHGRIDVAVLDAAAIGASLCQRNVKTASSVMFLLSVSDELEEYTRKKTKQALADSLAVNVDTVWLNRGGTEVAIPMAQLAVQDEIVVRMGSMIPVDGVVVKGQAMVNQATMTGEAEPVLKEKDSTVYAGTVVEEGALYIKVLAFSGDTRIQKIVEMIDRSENLKADIQSQAEVMADRIVPYSFLLSGVVLALTGNITKAVSVLMVDYSCAIKLSTPIAVISAMREAAGHQVMVKGGKYLEAMALADTIIFDKTGTLTLASPKVTKIIPFGKFTRERVLKTAACLEEHFPHSIARAIVKQAMEEGLKHREDHAEVQYVVAHGISSMLRGKRALIGSYHFIVDDEGVAVSPEEMAIIRAENEGRSMIYLAIDERLAGVICIEDPVRQEAGRVIHELRQLGVEQVVMLTGDGEASAAKVASELGIDHFKAQILPEYKAKTVEKLKAEGHRVIMVGDGINDSPALAAADVSIAMKDASDIAQEVADITLISGALDELVLMRRLSQKMLAKIDTQYRLIIGINSSLLALGLFGAITPATSALLHNLSTLAISVNAMRPCLPKETCAAEMIAV